LSSILRISHRARPYQSVSSSHPTQVDFMCLHQSLHNLLGLLYSTDDFYQIGKDLLVTQTSIDVYVPPSLPSNHITIESHIVQKCVEY
jgi:hypothetical protein